MATKKNSKSEQGLYFWFFCVFTVLCLAGVVAWLSLTPKNPNFEISAARLHASDHDNRLSHHNATVRVPNSSVTFELRIFNPNKRMGIYYDPISLELYGKSRVFMGRNSTPGFYQGYKNYTVYEIVVRSGREFWKGIDNGGDLEFVVRVKTNVRFKIIKWKTKARRVVHEEQFNKASIGFNGTFPGRKYAELQNATMVRIRN
ncbi:late embryogenesis abundant protein [Striga asiatica]|uniref:Late embryogenesis abundant protein n=1 Tax=Striga asiatica TaxID=4170 RepID=A0A5A7R9P0_STRAF|nr:late embryogenesis abundant protein [Striga asiatica]